MSRQGAPTGLATRLARTIFDAQAELDADYLDQARAWSEMRAEVPDDSPVVGVLEHVVPTHVQIGRFEVEVQLEATRRIEAFGQSSVKLLGRTISGFEAIRTSTETTSCTLTFEVRAIPTSTDNPLTNEREP